MSEREVELTSEEREVELHWTELDQLARAQHATWHIGCTRECGGRLGDSIKSEEWVAPVVKDILKRRTTSLAARLADAEARAEAILRMADEWEQATCVTDGAPCSFHRHASGYANDLREALRGDQ